MNRRQPRNSHSCHNAAGHWLRVDDIRQRTAEIRASWSEVERAHRRELSQTYAVVWKSLVGA